MRVEVKVPQLPESVAEATLVHWHKKVGGPVAREHQLGQLIHRDGPAGLQRERAPVFRRRERILPRERDRKSVV